MRGEAIQRKFFCLPVKFTPLEISSLKRKKPKFLKGFTLVEIMIVVGVIMILALLSIPQMLRSNITANESTAIGNLRNLFTSLQMYYVDNGRVYPAQLTDLSGDYISPALASGSKSGYSFSYAQDNEDQFHVNANPRTPGRTGTNYYYLDETNTIRYNSDGEAGPDDPSIAE